jgi:outer membrane protein TolC
MVNVTLDIPIETAGKRGYRVAQAQHLSEAARLNIASVAWAVRARLRQSLVAFYGAGETVDIHRQQRRTLENWVQLIESRRQAGAASPFEVTQARLELDRARLRLHDVERQRDEARVQLASAIGLPVSALQGTSISFVGLMESPPDLPESEIRRQALLNRADILGALAEYAASESAMQLEIAKQYPDVRLSPGYKYDQGENEWALGLSVDLPLLNQNQGPLAEAEARRAQTAARFQMLQAKVVAELDRSSAAYRAALAKVRTAEKLLVNQRTQREIAQARWSAGDISKLELSSIDLEVHQMALARLEAVVQAQQAFGSLEQALQRPILHAPPLWRQVAEGRAARKDLNHE